MTKAEYSRLLRWFQDYTHRFASEGGVLAPALELKRMHSLRVAENAQRIGQAIGLAGAELELATAAGLLHDVGRFTQYSRYGMFCDAETIDHGEEGHQVLTRAGSSLFETESDRGHVLCAVRYHNRKAEDIPLDLTPSYDRLLRLVRDADKIDIIELVLQSVEDDGFSALPGVMPDLRLTRDLTPAVLAKAMDRQSISFASLVTLGDLLLQLSAWFRELNYEPSRVLVTKKGILSRLRRELPDTREVDCFFESVLGVAPRHFANNDSHLPRCFG